MSYDKHPSDPWTRPRTLLESVLSDGLSAHREAIHEALRRIPALEAERDDARRTVQMAHELGTTVAAERDRLQKANDGQTRLNITLVMENKELIAERDRLTAFLERWADASAPDGWIGQMIVDRDKLRAEVQRWSVLAASFEAERNLLREEISDLHKANAARKQQ